jgi:hypothetical protein
MRRFFNYAVFYGIWILMILGETYAWAVLGLALGFVGFTIGGLALALYHHKFTEEGETPFGWPLRLAKWLTRRMPKLGLVTNTFLNGAGGVSIVETSLGSCWKQLRSKAILASVGYATVWCIIHATRPSMGIPVHWYPSLDALLRLIQLGR